MVLVTPIVTYLAARGGMAALNRWLSSVLPGVAERSSAKVFIEEPVANLLSVMLAAAATLGMATKLWGARRTTESWLKGSEGEVLTANALDHLPDSYVVFHDLRMPGSRANIDHVLIGPTGAFTIETKHFTSDVVIRWGRARHAGRSMNDVVDQATRQADAVREVLGCPVRALVCIQGAPVSVEGWFRKPVVDGVRFCSGPRLVPTVTRLGAVFDAAEVRDLASRCRIGLRSAIEPPTGAAARRPTSYT